MRRACTFVPRVRSGVGREPCRRKVRHVSARAVL
jgi:hypothetical protein